MGLWCNGITATPHAEGPGSKSLFIHAEDAGDCWHTSGWIIHDDYRSPIIESSTCDMVEGHSCHANTSQDRARILIAPHGSVIGRIRLRALSR